MRARYRGDLVLGAVPIAGAAGDGGFGELGVGIVADQPKGGGGPAARIGGEKLRSALAIVRNAGDDARGKQRHDDENAGEQVHRTQRAQFFENWSGGFFVGGPFFFGTANSGGAVEGHAGGDQQEDLMEKGTVKFLGGEVAGPVHQEDEGHGPIGEQD